MSSAVKRCHERLLPVREWFTPTTSDRCPRRPSAISSNRRSVLSQFQLNAHHINCLNSCLPRVRSRWRTSSSLGSTVALRYGCTRWPLPLPVTASRRTSPLIWPSKWSRESASMSSFNRYKSFIKVTMTHCLSLWAQYKLAQAMEGRKWWIYPYPRPLLGKSLTLRSMGVAIFHPLSHPMGNIWFPMPNTSLFVCRGHLSCHI